MKQTKYRTHTCGELRMEHVGQTVTLAGWLENLREVGSNFAFLVLRDFYGTTQVVVETQEMMDLVKPLNKESTIAVTGVVRERTSKNPKLPTGDIEVVPSEIKVLGRCRYNELPFEVNFSKDADESQRLKYRYLDLRNPQVKEKIVLRSQVVSALRRAMEQQGFLEITTPILTASSPEGARDYLVPARKHPGKFYALPQAPQQFKQLLMTSGFDKYFQIAPCFRDEDARGDRSPGEFYQLDMEMAFAGQEDVFTVIEQVLPPIFAQYGAYHIASQVPFVRIPYLQAMEEFGTDKPDLRIDLRVKDVTELLQSCGFGPFENSLIKAVPVSNCKLTRKNIDKLCADVEVQAGQKPYWFRIDENGEVVGGIAKFLNADPALAQQVKDQLSLENDTLVLLCAGTKAQVWKTSGVMVKMAGAQCEGHMDRERYEFCWIVDFPMYEIGEESGQLEFCHNPFSMPSGGLEVLLQAERGEVDPPHHPGGAVRPGVQRRGALLRRRAEPRPRDYGEGLRAGGPGGGGRAGQVPGHVQRLLLWRAAPRGHRPRGGPDGHAPLRGELHPGGHRLPHEQERPGRDDGRPLPGLPGPAGRAGHPPCGT